MMDHARSVFKKYDKDRSGTISPDEFAELCYDMGKTFDDAEERTRAVLVLAHDGALGAEEVDALDLEEVAVVVAMRRYRGV